MATLARLFRVHSGLFALGALFLILAKLAGEL